MRTLLLFTFLIAIALASCEKSGCPDPNANNYDPLAVKNNGSCIYLPPFISNLEAHIIGCKPPYAVSFTYELIDIIGKENFEWQFGDGESSNEPQPIHIYNNAGNITAKLRVWNPNGEDRIEVNINLPDSFTISSFFEDRAVNNNYRSPVRIDFDNLSRYATNYLWEFGDGGTSIDIDPTYRYTVPGRYKVKLHAICRGDTNTYEKDIEILGPPKSMEIKQIKIWLPPELIPDTLADPTFGLDPFVDIIHNLIPKGSGETFYDVRGFPVFWEFPRDLFGGTYVLSNLNFGPSEEVRINIFDDQALAAPDLLAFYAFLTTDWQADYYPELIEFEDVQAGFKIFLVVEGK